MVEQSREPFLLSFLCCYSHTVQSLGHSSPALCRVGVGLNDVLLGPRPFLPSLRRRSLFFVRLVHRYYGAVRLLGSVRVGRVALRLRGPASFPFGPRRSRGLPVLVHVVSQRARVLRLRRTDCSLALSRNSRVAFLFTGESRRPDVPFFEAQSPGPPIPLSTLQPTSHDATCKTEGQDGVAVSFLVGLFHSLQHAGLATTYRQWEQPASVTVGSACRTLGPARLARR